MHTRHIALALSVLPACVLAACSPSQQGSTSAAGNPQPPGVSASAAQVGHFHAELALVGQPSVTSGGKDILVNVNVTNDGAGTYGSENEPHNVNLGAQAIDAGGNVVIHDLARGRLPQVASGATDQASILLPVGETLGHRVQLVPVQEGVGWFNQWGTKPLVVGPFNVCSDAAVGKVCDASGNPLQAASVQP